MGGTKHQFTIAQEWHLAPDVGKNDRCVLCGCTARDVKVRKHRLVSPDTYFGRPAQFTYEFQDNGLEQATKKAFKKESGKG